MLTFCLFFYQNFQTVFNYNATKFGTRIVTFGKSRFQDDLSLCDFSDMLFSSIVIRITFLVVCETL